MKIDTELATCLSAFEGPVDRKTLVAEGKAHSNFLWKILSHLPLTKRIAERHFIKKSENVISFLNDQTCRRLHITETLPKNYLLTDRIFFTRSLFDVVGNDSKQLKEVLPKISDHRALVNILKGRSKNEIEKILEELAAMPEQEIDHYINQGESNHVHTIAVPEHPQTTQNTVWSTIQTAAKKNPGCFFAPTLPPVLQTISPTCSKADLDRVPEALNVIGPLFTEVAIVRQAIDNIQLLENQPDARILVDVLEAKKEPEILTLEALALLKSKIAEAKTSDNWVTSGIDRFQQEVQKAHDLAAAYRKTNDPHLKKIDFAHTMNQWDPLVLYLFVDLNAPAQKIDFFIGALNTTGLGFFMKRVVQAATANLPGLVTRFIDDMLVQIVQLACQSKAKQSVPLDSKIAAETKLLAHLLAVIAPQITENLDLLKPVLHFMSYLNKSVQKEGPIDEKEFKDQTIAFLEAAITLMETSFLKALEKGVENAPKALENASLTLSSGNH